MADTTAAFCDTTFRGLARQFRNHGYDYANLGLDAPGAARWANRGFTPDGAAPWLAAGFGADTAAYSADRFISPAEARNSTAAANTNA